MKAVLYTLSNQAKVWCVKIIYLRRLWFKLSKVKNICFLSANGTWWVSTWEDKPAWVSTTFKYVVHTYNMYLRMYVHTYINTYRMCRISTCLSEYYVCVLSSQAPNLVKVHFQKCWNQQLTINIHHFYSSNNIQGIEGKDIQQDAFTSTDIPGRASLKARLFLNTEWSVM